MQLIRFSFLQLSILILFCGSSLEAQITPNIPLSFSSFPPGTIIIDDQSSTRPSEFLVNSSCETEVDAYIFVANLDPIPNQPGLFQYPVGADPLYLRYQMGSNIGAIPIATFYPFDYHPVSGTPLYFSKITIPVDFSESCNNSSDGNPSINYNASLIDVNGLPYPFEHNDDYGQLFACDVFCLACDIPGTGTCILPEYFEGWQGTLDVNCNDCLDKASGPSGRARSAEDKSDSTVTSRVVKTQPNPFRTQLEISIVGTQAQTGELTIFDTQGQVVYSRELAINRGNNDVLIDTEKWVSGMYYGQIRSAGDYQTFKVLKID